MDQHLRNSLWNCLSSHLWNHYKVVGYHERTAGSNMHGLVEQIWADYFKEPTDTIPGMWLQCYKAIRARFFESEWYQVYEFVEFVAEHAPEYWREPLVAAVNVMLEDENAAYRFVHGMIVEITSEQEITAVEEALDATVPDPVRMHLEAALVCFAEREKPDYRNSIKESVSAVEAMARKITGKDSATLGEALRVLGRAKTLHPALEDGLSKIYGYTSDADGIRHAMKDKSNVTQADARLMLVLCSAFVGYLTALTAD